MDKTIRKPVTSFVSSGDVLIICDDGTLWRFEKNSQSDSHKWKELNPPLDGSDAFFLRGFGKP